MHSSSSTTIAVTKPNIAYATIIAAGITTDSGCHHYSHLVCLPRYALAQGCFTSADFSQGIYPSDCFICSAS